MVIQAYKKLKETFEEFSRPNGDQRTPAKTCRDLRLAHPEKPSGEVFMQESGFRIYTQDCPTEIYNRY